MINNCVTCLSSKVVSQNSDILAPMAVDAVLKIIDKDTAENVDLNNIRVSMKIGGTVDDSELIDGLCFTNNKVSHFAGGPGRIEMLRLVLFNSACLLQRPIWKTMLLSMITQQWIES